MFKLAQKKKEEEVKKKSATDGQPGFFKQVSIRSKFLTTEVSELEPNLPAGCKLDFPDVDDLREFRLTVAPQDGYWKGGRFVFLVSVPETYNISPPTVKCETRLYHPNITEDGKICLSVLREHSLDGSGWLPTRTLKDVVWGLNSLFTDLLNFEDPLNIEAAEHHGKDPKGFERKAREYVERYAKH